MVPFVSIKITFYWAQTCKQFHLRTYHMADIPQVNNNKYLESYRVNEHI